jgi:hypothetical protein
MGCTLITSTQTMTSSINGLTYWLTEYQHELPPSMPKAQDRPKTEQTLGAYFLVEFLKKSSIDAY